jgi:ABC transporter
MALLTLTNAHLADGHVPLLDGADFALEAGERIALIGRNGTGKSSLLRILAGLERPDDGVLPVQGGLRRVYVAQVVALSGGQKKRVALAQALVAVSDVLLRDGPTNHLDIDAIELSDVPDRAQRRQWLVLRGSVLIDGERLGPCGYHVVPVGASTGSELVLKHGALLFLREALLEAAAGDPVSTVRDADAGWPEFAPGIRRSDLRPQRSGLEVRG